MDAVLNEPVTVSAQLPWASPSNGMAASHCCPDRVVIAHTHNRIRSEFAALMLLPPLHTTFFWPSVAGSPRLAATSGFSCSVGREGLWTDICGDAADGKCICSRLKVACFVWVCPLLFSSLSLPLVLVCPLLLFSCCFPHGIIEDYGYEQEEEE